jgi:hypothetical protein
MFAAAQRPGRVAHAVLAVAILGQYLAVRCDQDRAEREVPVGHRLGRQLDAPAQVSQVRRGNARRPVVRCALMGTVLV